MAEYDYKELRAAAESGKQEDINALAEWFERYGSRYWNGEYYDADGIEIYPLYKYNPDIDDVDNDGWTTSSADHSESLKKALAAQEEHNGR